MASEANRDARHLLLLKCVELLLEVKRPQR
jgi:hypothetical protein